MRKLRAMRPNKLAKITVSWDTQAIYQDTPDFFVSQNQLKQFNMWILNDQAPKGHANTTCTNPSCNVQGQTLINRS